MIDFLAINEIQNSLNKLHPDTPAVFGKMNAQGMIEHLAFAISFSNGKLPQTLMIPERTSAILKHHTIHTNKPMSIGFKAPMLDDEPPALQFSDLDVAKQHLLKEINDFKLFFERNPHAKPVSPVLGELNFNEWIVFHNKHFTHHFTQFNLLEV